MTSVGRCTCSISQAVVADLPVPVAPSSTVSVSPALTRSAIALIAVGWSPEGSNSLTTRNCPRVGRRSVEVRTPTTVRRGGDRTARGEAGHIGVRGVCRRCRAGTGSPRPVPPRSAAALRAPHAGPPSQEETSPMTTQVWPGSAYPLGATYDGTGTNFAIYSEVAEKVELCLFDEQ